MAENSIYVFNFYAVFKDSIFWFKNTYYKLNYKNAIKVFKIP